MRDKRTKFVELANRRVNTVIKDLRLVGNLANRSNYEFTEDDIRKIVRALQRELDTTKAKFSDGGNTGDAEFRL